jgi:ABC-type nitrate/sulfonate/bicarbonate transport system permease component
MTGATPPRDRVGLGVLGFLVFLGLWESMRWLGLMSDRLLAFPSTMLTFLLSGQQIEGFGHALAVSAQQFGTAVVVAGAIGVAAGLVLGWYRRLGEFLEPLLVAAYSIPLIAIIPILIVFMGIGQRTTVAVVATFVFFPVFFAVSSAVSGADHQLLGMCRAFSGSDWDALRTIIVPSTLPAIIAALRLGVARGFIGLVVAEFFMGSGGLGSVILDSINQGAPVVTMLAVVVFCGANLALTGLLEVLYTRLTPWRTS